MPWLDSHIYVTNQNRCTKMVGDITESVMRVVEQSCGVRRRDTETVSFVAVSAKLTNEGTGWSIDVGVAACLFVGSERGTCVMLLNIERLIVSTCLRNCDSAVVLCPLWASGYIIQGRQSPLHLALIWS